MRSADGDRDDLRVVRRKGQASKPQVCLHLWRRVSAYHEETHGVSGDFLPKLCDREERERTPFRCGSFDCDCLSEELRERKGRKFCAKAFCKLQRSDTAEYRHLAVPGGVTSVSQRWFGVVSSTTFSSYVE